MTNGEGGTNEKNAIENAAIAKFIKYLARARGIAYRQTGRDVVINSNGTNYDFDLTPDDQSWPRIAVEVFRIFDSDGAAKEQRRQSYYWNALEAELDAAGVEPVLVSFPRDSAPVERKVREVAKAHAKLIKSALDFSSGESELYVEQFRVTRIPGLDRPVLSTLPSVDYLDAPGVARPQFAKNLAKKNSQLAVDGRERVVIVVNGALLVDPEDAIHAIATMDTSLLTNIDRVFFESRHHGFELIYDRQVRDSFSSAGVYPSGLGAGGLLDGWLGARLTERSDDAIGLVRRRTEVTGSMDWLDNRHTRTLVVNRISELVEAGDIELGLWAARIAVTDVDPPLENYPDDPGGQYNGHLRVVQHEDRISIGTPTVRGSVCWLLQKLVIKCGATHARELVSLVERLARDENAYVRMLAVVPLIELAVRRRRVDSHGMPLYSPELRERIRSLVMEMFRFNSGLPRILDMLALAIQHLGDLSEIEAAEVLDVLIPVVDHDGLRSAAWLLIFYAEYPEYIKGERPFDSTAFKSRLAESLKTGPTRLRSTLAFHMSKQFEHNIEAARRLLPYLPLFVSKGVEGSVLHHLFEILGRVLAVETSPEIEQVVVSAVECIIKHTDHSEVVFLMYSLVPILDALAKWERWLTVLGCIRLLAEAKGDLLYDRAQVLRLLGLVPEPFASDAQALGADRGRVGRSGLAP